MSKKLYMWWLIGWFCMLSPMITYASNFIIVSKKDMTLVVRNNQGDSLFVAPIACGKNMGNKKETGDYKTPEGKFFITQIYDSKKWKHDFNDGKGLIEGAYGPFFIRLHTLPFQGIGIHGTCFPETIGTRSSEGCIRMRNEDITRLVRFISKGTEVYVLSENK